MLGEVALDAAEGFALVGVGGDVVAQEHRDGPVTGDAHGNRLRNTGSHHVADGGPAEVVEEPAQACRLVAGVRPCLAHQSSPISAKWKPSSRGVNTRRLID